MNDIILGRLAALRQKMREKGIDAYLIPTDDFHASEYVGEHFKCRKYITGFTGSAGTALVTQETAGLWTDGRYFLQAGRELEGTSVTLFKMGETGVPKIEEYIENNMKEGQVLGFDGRTVTAKKTRELEKRLSPRGITLKKDVDLVGEIWADRPGLPAQPVWELDVKWAGETRGAKLYRIREAMREGHADFFVLASLDDIAWLLNLRGNDIPCNPVFLSYLILGMDQALLFAREDCFPAQILDRLHKDGVQVRPYEAVYEEVRTLPGGSRVLVDESRINSLLAESIPGDAQVLNRENPTLLPKACKNPTEVENIRRAHIKDGVAVTRFIYWLKHAAGQEPVTELSAADRLYALRREQEGFLGNSFDPILAYGAHGAIIHYSPTPETDVPIQAKGLVLADTGGQYYEGTTDITRTFAVGETTEEERRYFTAVLCAHLRLMAARFPHGIAGCDLDVLARVPLWELGADYNHGTGHGVGYVLNVHEGPQRIHWRNGHMGEKPAPFEEGMVTSDEPGYYAEGKFGIRHENLLVVEKEEKTDYGQFYRFAPLTMVPFDLEAVEPEQMSPKDRELLNAYHKNVYEALAPYFAGAEADWLKTATRAI